MSELIVKNKAGKQELSSMTNMLDEMRAKFSLEKDLNMLFRKFYGRNIIKRLDEGKFDMECDQAFRNFNALMGNRNSFIQTEFNNLEKEMQP